MHTADFSHHLSFNEASTIVSSQCVFSILTQFALFVASVTRELIIVNCHHICWQQDDETVFPISVSGVWSKYFAEFDAAAVIDQYFDRWAASPSARHFDFIRCRLDAGMPPADVKAALAASWAENGRAASEAGTRSAAANTLTTGCRFVDCVCEVTYGSLFCSS